MKIKPILSTLSGIFAILIFISAIVGFVSLIGPKYISTICLIIMVASYILMNITNYFENRLPQDY